MAQKETKKNIFHLAEKVRARSRELAIPRKIGFTKEEVKQIKKDRLQKNLRPIRKNNYDQIISYALNKDNSGKVIVGKDGYDGYGKKVLPAKRNTYNRVEFFRTIDPKIETYTRKIAIFDNRVVENNAIPFPLGESGEIIEEVSGLNFTGELIRVGSGPTTYFYIEDGQFYTFANGHQGLFSLLAEKLGKPLGFRINDEYDYSDEYKPANAEQIDYGMNQYSVYNKETYTRNSIAYVESNQFGGELTKRMILGSATDEIIVLTANAGADVMNRMSQLTIYGLDSTKMAWRYFPGTLARQSITSTENPIYIQTRFSKTVHDSNVQFEMNLKYSKGQSKLIRELPKKVQDDDKAITYQYEIPASDITSDLYKIEIRYFDGYNPFGVKGTDGEYRWESITSSPSSTTPPKPRGGFFSRFGGRLRGFGRLFGR